MPQRGTSSEENDYYRFTLSKCEGDPGKGNKESLNLTDNSSASPLDNGSHHEMLQMHVVGVASLVKKSTSYAFNLSVSEPCSSLPLAHYALANLHQFTTSAARHALDRHLWLEETSP